MHLTNTIEEFKQLQPKALLYDEANVIWQAVVNGEALRSPRLLNRVVLLAFAVCFLQWSSFRLPFVCRI